MTNLQQMAQTICYVQEHGYNTKADMEHDRQMNITALNKLTATITNVEIKLSSLESSSNYNEHPADSIDILKKTRKQLLSNQEALRNSIRNLNIVSANVDAILRYEPIRVPSIEKTQDLI